ncbi:MAG: four helix bundle protein [Candidatus Taylorbacteria bacterium]|nr:four helix bundle protein [Candidatus Taylorbacteria bacterium]
MNIIKKVCAQPKKLSGIPLNILEAYVFWQSNSRHIPKMLRYSMGVRIDSIFAEIIETIYLAIFADSEKKIILIDKANTKNDLLKFMLYALFELKGLKEDAFYEISLKMEEIGRRLYGWRNQTEHQNQNGSAKVAEPFGKNKK